MWMQIDGRMCEVSEGARKLLTRRGFTIDAESSGPACGDPNEIDDRLEALERAVAILAMREGGEGDDPDAEADPDDDNGETGEPDDAVPSVQEQLANRSVQDQESGPPTPAEINAANLNAASRGLWNTQGHNMTGGSGSVPPNSRKAEGASYMPGKAAPNNRILSQTGKTIDPGRTWTGDHLTLGRVSPSVGRKFARQAAGTADMIRSISAKNAEFYARRG